MIGLPGVPAELLVHSTSVCFSAAQCLIVLHMLRHACLTVAGYDDVKTVVVLGSDVALRKAQGARSLLGADFDVIVGKDSAVVQSDVSQTQAIPYSMADGALIDFSVKGMPTAYTACLTIHALLHRPCSLLLLWAWPELTNLCAGGRVTVDNKLNKQLYGPSVTADHILAGDVDAPEEMKPLYNSIHRLIVQAGTSTL